MRNFLTNQFLLKSLLFVFVFFIFLQFAIDPDFGWHLVLGRRLVEAGEILRTDNYSWTTPGYHWGNSYFLYQALVAFVYNFFGYKFLVVLFAAISTISVFLLVKKIDPIKFVAVVLGARLALSNLSVRPHTISFLFFAILLLLLEKQFYVKKTHILFWLLFFALWANLHRGFVVGIGVFSVYLTIAYFYRKSFGKKMNIKIPIFCVLAAVVASFLTPFSLDLYKTGVASDFLTLENLKYIAEWQSVVIFFQNNIYYAATGVIYIYIFLTKARKMEPVWFLIAALLFALGFISTNFVFFWCVLFIFVCCRHLDINTKNRLVKGTLFIFGLGFMVYVLYSTFSDIKKYVGNGVEEMLVKDGYPVEAIKYMRAHEINSNLLNLFGWGGFLLWQYPEAKVFIDGRMAGWKTLEGKSILGIYMDLKSGKCEALNTYRVETLLVSKAFDLSCFVDFREVYRDDVAKVLVRKEN